MLFIARKRLKIYVPSENFNSIFHTKKHVTDILYKIYKGNKTMHTCNIIIYRYFHDKKTITFKKYLLFESI